MIRRTLFFVGSFGSIAVLLGHLYGIASMRTLALVLWLPLSLGMGAAWSLSRAKGDADFLLKVRTGFLGGLWGTIGYDLVRIPFHLAGQNPFPPIRAYGVWLSGTAFSNPFTDGLGFFYHLSNGITFGWIYSFLFLRKHWGWGLGWGLLLETIAVSTAFGEVFRLRAAYGALGLAYAAHLFYGFPLGIICQRPEGRSRMGLAAPLFLAAVFLWFVTAWQPIGKQPPLQAGQMLVGRESLYPGWSDRPLGSVWVIRNLLPEPVQVKVRRPKTPLKGAEEFALGPSQSVEVPLIERGIYQFGAAGKPWRSIFLSVAEEGNYRP